MTNFLLQQESSGGASVLTREKNKHSNRRDGFTLILILQLSVSRILILIIIEH